MKTLLILVTTAACAQEIPKTWDEAALHSMELPLATASATPVHISAERYYAIPPITVYKSYPISVPGKTAEEYRSWLLEQEPVRFDAASPRTRQDWNAAGKFVFESPTTFLPEVPARVGGAARFVIRTKGKIEYGTGSCISCHRRVMDDGSVIDGAQFNLPRFWHGARPRTTLGSSDNSDFATPWLTPDPNVITEATPQQTVINLFTRIPSPLTRFNTSVWSPAAMPDLIGIRERKYLDRTGLVQHRGPADLMRYAAFNVNIGGVSLLNSYNGYVPNERIGQARQPFRFGDSELYALTMYIYSLESPKNPNPFNAEAAQGQKLFQREGCATCHPAPLYTNNKLTPAPGFRIPDDHKRKYDIMPVSVGTDPWLATKTRRGTGYYKVPSLRGVWYRGPFEHNGSVVSLEDWFDSNRLNDEYVPTGWLGPNATRAVKGHEFGLQLEPEEKEALIAFLKTL